MKRIITVWSLVLLLGVLSGCQEGSKPEGPISFSERLRLAEEGDSESQNIVGVAYLQGTDITRDLERAVYWFQKAGESGNSTALYNLGILYQEGKYVGQDHERAFGYFLDAARRGLPEAQMSLGWLYEGGLGTVKDMTEAVYWYRRSATFGKAANRERAYYAKHLLSHRERQFLYGNRDAQFLLGKLFEEGDDAFEPNLEMAVEWYEDAAVRGDGPSAGRLAVLLGLRGQPRSDPIMGYAWANVAVETQAFETAGELLASIEKTLGPDELSRAQEQSLSLLELIEFNRSNL